MKIGNITLGHNGPVLALAPMAGVTDITFRKICRSWGAELTVTEMLSAKAIHYNDCKTAELCRFSPDEHPAAAQLFGREPEIMAEAAQKLLENSKLFNRPDIIDINLGCPMPKITSNGEGSALMREPELAAKIIAAVVRAVSPVPVTVKLRSGWDYAHINAVEIARLVEESGAAALTVHGRTRSQMYAPPVDSEVIAAVKRAVTIPVFANGGVMCAADALELLEKTGCDGIAVARGAQGRPWIFKEIRSVIEGRAFTEPTYAERLRAAISHMRACCADKGARGVLESRGQLSHYIKNIPGAAQARDAVNRAGTADELEAALNRLLDSVEE
jgi:putative TIM-barrel protein, nifR3 family